MFYSFKINEILINFHNILILWLSLRKEFGSMWLLWVPLKIHSYQMRKRLNLFRLTIRLWIKLKIIILILIMNWRLCLLFCTHSPFDIKFKSANIRHTCHKMLPHPLMGDIGAMWAQMWQVFGVVWFASIFAHKSELSLNPQIFIIPY